MNSKTWLDIFPVFIILPFLVFGAAFIPTFELKGKFYGGGPIREYIINKSEVFLPNDIFFQMKQYFLSATVTQETILYSIFALNIILFLLWATYIFGGIYITIFNKIGNSAYQSKRKAIRS
jgi:hypothetical protein